MAPELLDYLTACRSAVDEQFPRLAPFYCLAESWAACMRRWGDELADELQESADE